MHQSTVLVVGGTGMLRPAVRSLAEAGSRVLVAARSPKGITEVGPTGSVSFVGAHWERPRELADSVRRAAGGPLERAVLWVHAPFRAAVEDALGDVLADDAVVVRLYGSAAQEPSPAERPPWTVRNVVLGSKIEAGRRRWLTHGEISSGALRALEATAPGGAVLRVGD
ncbi:Rossmann-fold NAD(P)-binding domain-containing protein [Salininema proteolyticum]|uniref:Short chain dehydrogenase n=1 Tax=Salininema proteolyticum TaxID=1607685 RepID=A0ABV8TSV5_9ACTN